MVIHDNVIVSIASYKPDFYLAHIEEFWWALAFVNKLKKTAVKITVGLVLQFQLSSFTPPIQILTNYNILDDNFWFKRCIDIFSYHLMCNFGLHEHWTKKYIIRSDLI